MLFRKSDKSFLAVSGHTSSSLDIYMIAPKATAEAKHSQGFSSKQRDLMHLLSITISIIIKKTAGKMRI